MKEPYCMFLEKQWILCVGRLLNTTGIPKEHKNLPVCFLMILETELLLVVN